VTIDQSANQIQKKITDRLEHLEKEIAALKKRQPDVQSPFLRRTEAIKLLKTRSVLEACERAGWITASTRQPRLVLFKRVEIMAAVYRISQGEFP
jgi:hypothetical protein